MNFFPATYFVPLTIVSGYVANESDAPNRIYAQYRNKPKVVAWYNITRSLATQIADVAVAVRIMYSIDYAHIIRNYGNIILKPIRHYVGEFQ